MPGPSEPPPRRKQSRAASTSLHSRVLGLQSSKMSERDTFSVFSEIRTVYSGAVFRMPNGNNGGSLIFTYDHRDSLF